MNVRVGRASIARIKTTNGDLDLRAASGATKCASTRSHQRRPALPLARRKVDAEFDIETFNGEIDNCFGPEGVRTREYGPGNELHFTEGNGDARVRVKTLNGGVEICNR